MGDSQHSPPYGRCGPVPSSVDVNSTMAANSTGLRYSGVLSPLAWQAPRPNSPVSLTVLGLNRRDTLSTSSTAPSNVSLSAGHRRQHPRGPEHRGVPALTPSSSCSSRVMDAVGPAGSPLSVDAASPLTLTERAVLLGRLRGFHDFAERLPGYYTGDRVASAAVVSRRSDADAVVQGFQFPEQPRVLERPLALPSQQQQQPSGSAQKLVPLPSPVVGAPQQGKSAVSFPKSCDASITCEVANVSIMSVLSEASHRRPDEAGRLERSSCKEGEEDRPATAPAAGPPRMNGTSHSLNHAPDTEAPPGVTETFHRYLEQTRERILCADISDSDRASALDGLLIRCLELFGLLRDMYTVMNAQGPFVDRKNLSMVKVLPYDEVSSSTSSSVSSVSSIQLSAALRTQRSRIGDKGSLLLPTTRPLNSHLPPLSRGPLAAATGMRPQDAFERGRRTSTSSCSSGVACIDVVNNYYVTRLIGVGATGRVYLAMERKSCKMYAIKTVTRNSRKTIGRRFPVVSLSASDSEALRSDGSLLASTITSEGEALPLGGPLLGGSRSEGAVARGDRNPISNAALSLVRPLSIAMDSASPTMRQDDVQDGLNVSLRESAIESLVHLATISHPSDSVIPFVASATVSVSAMPFSSPDGEVHNGVKRMPPLTSTGKYPKAPNTPTHGGDTAPHATVIRSAKGCGSAGGDGTSRSLNSTPTGELSPVEREIRIMRRVRNHPNVVRLKEVIDDEEEDSVHLVMTYAENGPLTVMHGFDTTLGCAPCDVVRPFSRCTRLLHQLAEALIYVHRQRIVHNDVKPDNILLTEADNILLTDFGESVLISKKPAHLSTSHVSIFPSGGEGLNTSVLVPHNRWKSSRGEGDSWAALSTTDRPPWCPYVMGHNANLSQMVTEVSFLPDSSMFLAAGVDVEGRLKENRSAIGTPAFAAPELIMNSTCSYDSDAWSFGVVLYSVIFGRLPFAAATISDTFDEILHSSLSFPALEEVPQRVGMTETAYDQWVELCTKLLVREPQQRLPLSAVLRHPLFRRPSVLSSRSFISVTGGMEISRARYPPSGLHCDLSSAPNRRRSFRSNTVSLLPSGREGPHLLSRTVRATISTAMPREAAAAAAGALSSGRCSVDKSISQLTKTSSAGRDDTLESQPVQTATSKNQKSSCFAGSGDSTTWTSPPLSTASPACARKATIADDGVLQASPDVQPGSATRLERSSATQDSPLTGRYSLLGASTGSTASFTATEQLSRLRENTLVYNQCSAGRSSSTSESLINPSLFSTSIASGDTPPDHIVTPVMQLTSCTEFASPSPRPITRAGSSTPELSWSEAEGSQQGKHDRQGSSAAPDPAPDPDPDPAPAPAPAPAPVPASGSGTSTTPEALPGAAPPMWLSSTPLGGCARTSGAGQESHEGTKVPVRCVHEGPTGEEPCEGERGSVADFNGFSYWDSSMSELADSRGSEVEEVQEEEKVSRVSQQLSPHPRRSPRPSLDSRKCVKPLVSVQEVSTRHEGQKDRCKHVQFMPGLSAGDATIGLGGCCSSATPMLLSPRARGAKALTQQRVSKPSPPSEELKADGGGRVCLSSLKSSRKSASELSPAKTKSWPWRHR